MNRLQSLALALLSLSLVPACGVISLGSGTGTDPIPSGIVVYQGNLAGTNGKSVSGVVSVYRQTCPDATNCSFVLRLQDLSAPAESNLQVIPTVGNAPSLTPKLYTLQASTGSKNYTFAGAPSNASWAQVAIHPSASQAGLNDYGVATLTSTGNSGP